MFRATKKRMVGLVAAGALALAGAGFAGVALAGGPLGSAIAQPATQVQLARTTPRVSTDAEWRAEILDMLEDHMGITGEQAEKLADQMAAHIRGLGRKGDDWKSMVDWCSRHWSDDDSTDADDSAAAGPSNGRGMMNGWGGMMNGAGPGGMMGGWDR